MAPHSQRSASVRAASVRSASVRNASVRAAGAPAPGAERPSPDLEVARAPGRTRRSIGGIGMVLALGLFGVCLALAALHAVLVENQAALDDLLARNQQRYERIDELQAEIAHLDSPEGLADRAHAAGLVPSADLAVLTPIGPDLLPPPEDDPFDLASSGRLPAPPAAQPPEAPELGTAAG